jgi:hypothetical protein
MVIQQHFSMEQLQLYNSLSRRVEPFRPAQPTVTVYICGITPYATTHLGHAFTYAMADTLIRLLEHQGYRVCYVQNLTDIDSMSRMLGLRLDNAAVDPAVHAGWSRHLQLRRTDVSGF